MLRHSKQRDAILWNLQSRRDHPSADMIFESLRGEYPNLSLGTVYRNLQRLAEAGVIARLPDHDKDRFDAVTVPHVHFYCDSCKSVSDVPLSSLTSRMREVEKALSCEVTSVDISMHGLCAACRDKIKKKK